VNAPAERPAADDVDRGVAERVEFAWHRTALALAGIGLVLVRRVVPAIPARPAIGVLLIAVGVVSAVGVVGWREYARRRGVSRRAHLRLVTAGAVLIGVVSFIVGAVP